MAFGRKKEAEPDTEKPLETYGVTYKGGLRDLPKAKIGKVEMEIHPDRFELKSTTGSRKFWTDLTIPYVSITSVEITDRTVSTAEALLGGVDSRQLNQKNNIHITYNGGQLLRLEMLSGVTVMGQAKKCLELEDLLRVNAIVFGASTSASGPGTPSPPPPPPHSAPAAWYPDPNGAQLQRYWDGSAWTEHTAPLP